MKALFIGGTGVISESITRLAAERGWTLTLLNRGRRNAAAPADVECLTADIHDEAAVKAALGARRFDVVADFIAYVPAHVERDIRLFADKTDQYIFISSASAYQKPPAHYRITESTPLVNPRWQYSRDKIACEEVLMAAHRAAGFPVTVVRPSHTYDYKTLPLGLHGAGGAWGVVSRIHRGRPVLIQGDGTSLWTVTHSSDFAKAFVRLMGHPAAVGEAVQITGDEVLTWNQIYQTVGRLLGVPVRPYHVASDFLVACDPSFDGPLLGDKAHSVVFDNSKMKRLAPEFTATTRFDEGARQSVAYFLSHPECQAPDAPFDDFCDRVVHALDAAAAAVRGA
ncbi:MAG: SDR family oxidoreductase [Oscillospiraceae bacterium]|jgi:nucleoside-diphosphate-sugar epimerase|nr:SDR family oxidoreductase [Oscillospiraceae bacterium]